MQVRNRSAEAWDETEGGKAMCGRGPLAGSGPVWAVGEESIHIHQDQIGFVMD